MKVLTLVGTRPEIIKLCRVIAELEQHTNHILVHTGQNFDYELNEVFFEQLGLRRPDHFLNAAADTPAATIGNVIAKADQVFAEERPDALLLLGDTNSCMAAIAAKRRKIPIFHMEAGNRSFDQRVPEEINRKIIDHISDINMPYTDHARRYLIAEGIKAQTIIKTGSPMREVLNYYAKGIEASDVLDRLEQKPGDYFVLSAHREENVDSEQNLTELLDSLKALVEHFDKDVLFSVHPRTRKRLDALGMKAELGPRIHAMKPLGFLDYVKLQKQAFCVISDSGTLTEEAALLDFPAVMIRQAHERPEGADVGTLIMCGLGRTRVIEAISIVTAQHSAGQYSAGQRVFEVPNDYAVDNVSKKVLRNIISCTDSINRFVWFK